jgi:hypothetical protein
MLDEGLPRWGLLEDLWPYTSWLHTAKKYVLKGRSGGAEGGGTKGISPIPQPKQTYQQPWPLMQLGWEVRSKHQTKPKA